MTDHKGLSVLLIDDEEDLIRTLAMRLTLRGLRAKTAFSGEAGLQSLREELPDVVLLDMRMPGLSGFEVLQRIRATHKELPVFIVSGHCSEQDRDQVLALGISGYFTKPVHFAELLAALHNL